MTLLQVIKTYPRSTAYAGLIAAGFVLIEIFTQGVR